MKMKMHRLAVAATICLLLCLATVGALGENYGVVYRTDTLNLRSQGSSSSQWLGSYNRGTWVEIIGSQNNFYRVHTPDGRTGYMSKNYIDVDYNADDYAWMAVVDNANGGAFLNFRAQPSYNAQVLDIFYNGVPLHVLNESHGWYCVEINGQVGYVRGEYVTDWGRCYGSSTVATIKTPNNTAMNMRSGPGMNYPVIRQFTGDSYVSVLAQGTDWWCVSADGSVGFMSSDYLVEGLHSARDTAAGTGGSTGGTPYAMVSNPRSTQALNLRQYASTASMVLDKLYNGDRLWVDEQGTEWCAVTDQASGLSGYVMTQYIRLYNLPSKPTRRVYHPSGTYVNLRSAPNLTQNNVRVRVPSGSTVTILTPGPDWCKVQYNGYTGYMMNYFLQ